MKVFLTNAPDREADIIKTKDFNLSNKDYYYSLSCMLAANTEEGEAVKVIIFNAKDENEAITADFLEELEQIKNEKALQLEVDRIAFNSLARGGFKTNKLMDGFRLVTQCIGNNDQVFTDLCYGGPVYCQILEVATYYVLQTTEGVTASLYGAVNYEEQGLEIMELVSLDNLVQVSRIAGKMNQGSREIVDSLLNIDFEFFKDNDDNDPKGNDDLKTGKKQEEKSNADQTKRRGH